MDFFDEWDEAKWYFTYGDDDEPDNVVLQGGLVIVLYLLKSYAQSNRSALASVMLRLQEIMGRQLRWGYWEHPRKRGKYTPEHFSTFVEWVRTRPPTHAIEFTWSSGPGYDFVGDWGGRGFSQGNLFEEEWKTVSYFQVYLPVEVLRGDGRSAFERLLAELAMRLPVLHGYAGLGLQQCDEFHRYENLELELAEQFLGFDVADPMGHPEFRDGIKSVNWYTILHRSWLEKLGGREGLEQAIQDEASSGLSLVDYANGVMLKAGEWPSLGWTERDPQPAAYVAANRLLKPIRVPELRCLHMGSIMGETRFDNVSTDQWLRRFDAPGIWPPRGLTPTEIEPAPPVDEPAVPVSLPPAVQPTGVRVLSARPGQPCPREGDWFSPFLKRTERIKQGDLMPGPDTTQQGAVTWYLREPDV
ncbi:MULTISPECIES: type VI immunity family protein [unclassified Burkholderia]|uniref:type VI immunity family protein n=1 Tax=unclassified Burkholderia TaxID=2613784 RepID=UPI00158E05D9|nr:MULTISPECIES: type VI immunity family protein [unclassified Burkholderia]